VYPGSPSARAAQPLLRLQPVVLARRVAARVSACSRLLCGLLCVLALGCVLGGGRGRSAVAPSSQLRTSCVAASMNNAVWLLLESACLGCRRWALATRQLPVSSFAGPELAPLGAHRLRVRGAETGVWFMAGGRLCWRWVWSGEGAAPEGVIEGFAGLAWARRTGGGRQACPGLLVEGCQWAAGIRP
jgi:hypothetical protein